MLIRSHSANFSLDFTSLVDQYTKIIRPLEALKEKIAKEAGGTHAVLHTVRYAHEWDKQTRLKKEALQEEDEKSRIAYQSVDWHDFLLVDTITFGPEDSDLPPPVSRGLGVTCTALPRPGP